MHRNQIHICLVSTLHAADDKRVHHKEAVALVRAGYRVSHVVRDDGGDGASGVLDGVRLIRFPARGRGVGDRLRRLRGIYRLARDARADVYHCNEADSWVIGVFLTLFSRARLVHDVHEINSSNLAERRFPPWARPFVVACLRMFFVPLSLMTDRFVFAKGSVGIDYPLVPARKIMVAANYVELPDTGSPAPDRGVPQDGDTVTLLHLGAINRQRGWPQMLEALALAQDKRLRLRVVGRFGDDSEAAFLETAARLGLADRVEFAGLVPYDRVRAEVARADIGVIAFQPVMLNFTHALPHKLFDYMLGALPVVVPDFAVEVEDIVRRADCGLTVAPDDPVALARAFDRLAGDAGECRRMGENGRRAVLDRYNWGHEAERLIAFYDALTGATPAKKVKETE